MSRIFIALFLSLSAFGQILQPIVASVTHGGGGGPVAGYTARFIANVNTDVLHVDGTPPTTPATNGQTVAAWGNDTHGATDLYWHWAHDFSTWNSTGINSTGALSFAPSLGAYMNLLNGAGSNKTWADLVAANAATIFVAVKLPNDCSNAADASNTAVLSDSGGYYLGLACKTTTTGTNLIYAGGYDGAAKVTPAIAVTQSAPHILMLQHTSSSSSVGTLTVAIDCATSGSDFQTITMGDMFATNTFPLMMSPFNQANILTGLIGEAIFYNTALSAPNIATTCTYLKAKWGA